ncbi:TPA: amino acid ABC transporter ATP-binding protein, partial [Streptococcus suis]|nr:amino acid ABC transporter ATP-binding protein [Streptococcus suis]
MLEVKNIEKSFGDKKVLDGVSLRVDQGDVVVILGPSGSGKTTFLRTLNYLEKADAGKLTLDEKNYDLAKISRKEVLEIRQKTAFVFQNYNLFANKTAIENILEGLVIARKIPKAEALEIAEKALAKVGLSDKRDSYPSQLSGGQQQRIGIARAIAVKPDVILFDEPTSALDPELIGDVLSVM